MPKNNYDQEEFHYINPLYAAKYNKNVKQKASDTKQLTEQEKFYMRFYNPDRDYKCSMKQCDAKIQL